MFPAEVNVLDFFGDDPCHYASTTKITVSILADSSQASSNVTKRG